MDKYEDISLTQVPFGAYEFVDVTFAAADTDTLVPVSLKVEHPKFVRWIDVTPNAGAFVKIYRSTGSELVENNLKLRCNVANYKTRLLLFIERSQGGQSLNEGAVSTPDVTATLPSQVSDSAYGAGWNGVSATAPSQNAVYDKIEAVLANATFGTLTVTGTTTPQGLVDISGAGAGQIKFPASQNASADANTLDDYEEGSWTPVFGGTTGTSGQTYNTQVGRYVKVGKKVMAWFTGTLSNVGTVSGFAQISGLPFTSENVTNFKGSMVIVYWTSLTTAIVTAGGFVNPNTSVSRVEVQTGAATSHSAISATNLWSNNTHMVGFITYSAG